jgi:Family of unknown function (DUF6130)
MQVHSNQHRFAQFAALVMAACLMAAPGGAQTARQVRGAAAVEPIANEPAAMIVVDPPLAEPLSRGLVVIQYRTENLHIAPVFGPAALTCSFLSEPSDIDCLSDVDGHSIFAKFNGTGITLFHKRQYRRRGVVVREHRKSWLDLLKYPACL